MTSLPATVQQDHRRRPTIAYEVNSQSYVAVTGYATRPCGQCVGLAVESRWSPGGAFAAGVVVATAGPYNSAPSAWSAITNYGTDMFAWVGWTGVALCLFGFSLAINARRHLGRNWGLPMSRKEQPELVTTGPYALIRHPIYTGLILAMLGSAIGVNVFWALLLVPVGAYFIYSARREETVMLQLFPEQYAAYMARTGMFAPCPFRRR